MTIPRWMLCYPDIAEDTRQEIELARLTGEPLATRLYELRRTQWYRLPMRPATEQAGDDLTGQRFGRLVVTGFGMYYRELDGNRKKIWACLCDCGNTRDVRAGNLRSGNTKSCGCIQTEIRAELARKLGSRPR